MRWEVIMNKLHAFEEGIYIMNRVDSRIAYKSGAIVCDYT